MMLKLVPLFLIASTSALAAEPPVRAPAGKWSVDFDDSQCVAFRDYGTAEQPLRFFIKAPPAGGVIQIGLQREGSRRNAEQTQATVTIGDEAPIKTTVLTYSPSGQKQRIDLINLPKASFAPAARAGSMAIRFGSTSELLALSQMQPLLKVMAECVASLREDWNVQAEGAPSPLRQRARGNLASFFDDRDYPAAALGNDQDGAVKFVALIDETGRVADCTLTKTSGVAVLDAQTCALLKSRGKMEPAIGADGKPARDVVFQTVSWRIEG